MRHTTVPAFSLEPGELQLASDHVPWVLLASARELDLDAMDPGEAPRGALLLSDRRLALVRPDRDPGHGVLRRFLTTMSTRRLLLELRRDDLVRVEVGPGRWSAETWLALHDHDGSVLAIAVREPELWRVRFERWRDEEPLPAPLPEARVR